MRKRFLISGAACLLIIGLLIYNYKPHNIETITPISLTRTEKEISELAFSYLVGYEFYDLNDAEIRINLVHDGRIIQNYQSFFLMRITF